MFGLLKVPTIIFFWLATSFILLLSSVFLYNIVASHNTSQPLDIYTSKNVFDFGGEIDPQKNFLASVAGGDSRSALISKFLSENNSPMANSAGSFVNAAEKYNLDWRLLPAIAFTESTLGKKTPFGSYNAFGWGITDNTNKGADFDSWEEAIFTVAKGLREDYYNQGLTNIKSINYRYAGDNNWHIKVKNAMSDLTN